MTFHGKLGFFDSGIGGLTVMHAFQKLYPQLDMEYFGDSKNCPYGDRPHEEIVELVDAGVARLVDAGCVIIILACNTAVAHAVKYLQTQKYPEGCGIKILGVTLPGAEKAIELNLKRIGVLATTSTVQNQAYRDRVHLLNPTVYIEEIAVPGLVNQIEKPVPDTDVIQTLLHRAIQQFSSDLEAIILGCTHYPLVQDEIRAVWQQIHGTPIDLIDPGVEAAIRFESYQKRHPEYQLSQNGEIHIT